jgi:hypothetical protein
MEELMKEVMDSSFLSSAKKEEKILDFALSILDTKQE